MAGAMCSGSSIFVIELHPAKSITKEMIATVIPIPNKMSPVFFLLFPLVSVDIIAPDAFSGLVTGGRRIDVNEEANHPYYIQYDEYAEDDVYYSNYEPGGGHAAATHLRMLS